MKISPQDIRKAEFSSGLRGYDPDEVQKFLEEVAVEVEELEKERQTLKHRISELEERTTEFRQMEDVLKGTLSDAHETAEKLRENAKRDAARIIEDAKSRAEEITTKAENRLEEIKSKIQSLRGQRLALLEEMEEMLANYTRVLERLKKESAIDETKD